MKRIAVFTSGGDAPGMNAAIRAVVRAGINSGVEVFGIERGYEGMIDGAIKQLVRRDVSDIIQTGGTILGTARSKSFRTINGRAIAAQNLITHKIDGLVAIGGNGTFTGAHIFFKEHNIPIVGIPGTIDNDLYGTDFTIGYDTAINTAMNAIDKIKDTANAHNRIFFIEVMGRDAGFIAARCGIACGAEAVLIPENMTNMDALLHLLKHNYDIKKKASIIIVAEGDDAGGAFAIADMVKQHTDLYDIRVSILGHIQRGGSPTCMERVRASRLGIESVKALLSGKNSVMLGLIHHNLTYTPFEKAVKYHHRLNPVLSEMVTILS